MTWASLYVRLSERADGSNLSLDGMIDDMRALCAREGLDVLDPVRVDDGRSGGRRDRKAFQQWLHDGRSGRAHVLVTPATDRLTREGLNVAASILDVIEGKDPSSGRVVHAPVRLMDTKGLDSDHGDSFRLQFVIAAEIGRGELRRISERAKDTKRRLAAQGRWAHGAPPFGYEIRKVYLGPDEHGRERSAHTLVVNPAEAEILRECVRRVIAGYPLYKVCHWLNEQPDAKPRRTRSGQFSVSSLRHILTQGTSPYLAKDETPVVSSAELVAVRTLLNARKGSRPNVGRRPARLLSTLLTCSGCGTALQVARRSERPVYRCQVRSLGGVCERPVTVSCEPVEEYVTGKVLSFIGPNRMTREETVVIGAEDLADIELEISEVGRAITKNLTPELLGRLQELQRRRDAISNRAPETRTTIVDLGMTGFEWWESATMDDRRDLVSSRFPVMELLPGQRGRHGFDPARLPLFHGEPDHEYEAWLQREG